MMSATEAREYAKESKIERETSNRIMESLSNSIRYFSGLGEREFTHYFSDKYLPSLEVVKRVYDKLNMMDYLVTVSYSNDGKVKSMRITW